MRILTKNNLLSILANVELFKTSVKIPERRIYMKKFFFFFLLSNLIFNIFSKTFYIPSDDFKSINEVLKKSKEEKSESLTIFITQPLFAESVIFEDNIKSIVISGVSTPSNLTLNNTVFINRGSNIDIQIQNLNFKSFVNEKSIKYFSFFFNMCENLINKGIVEFTDLFSCEIIDTFIWNSSGYSAFSQGKNVGDYFSGVKSNLFKTINDTFILYGIKGKNVLYLYSDKISNIMKLNGEFRLLDKLSVANFSDTSIYGASFLNLNGDLKVKGKKDSMFFNRDNGDLFISGNLNVNKGINFGKNRLRIFDDGSFNYIVNYKDTFNFKNNNLDLKRANLSTSGKIFSGTFINYPDKPLLFKYNYGNNYSLRWAFLNSDKNNDYSFFEDKDGNIVFKRNVIIDSLSEIDISLNTPVINLSFEAKDTRPGIFNRFKLKNIIFNRDDKTIEISQNDDEKIIFKKDGYYNIFYSVTFSSLSKNDTKFCVRLKLNRTEIPQFNSVTIRKNSEGFSKCSSNGVLKV